MTDELSAFPGPPDLAIEVLSPGNTNAGMHAKVADYLAAGTVLVGRGSRSASAATVKLLNPQIVSAADAVSANDLLPD